MALGPVMIDLGGVELAADEREMLLHPATGGVLLFSRNYESPEQVARLVESIHEVRRPRLLIAVDHEGGRVQRFRERFTRLPSAGSFGLLQRRDPKAARAMAELAGWVMAVELRAVGVDFSFAPVLDLDRGFSEVIGDRGFHGEPEVVSSLARAYIHGMHRAGMAATGKHFPGHGGVRGDSHHSLPVDERSYHEIETEDMLPFERLAERELAGMMPAHVIYSQVDSRPAGFSPIWIREVLRGRLGFQGAVFSDDLSMAGAEFAGDYPERARMALEAGCDMVLVCNNPAAAGRVLESLSDHADPVAQARLARMHGRHPIDLPTLHADPEYGQAVKRLLEFEQSQSQELGL